MEIKFCPECGERLESSVYEGNPVYLCYDCEVVIPVESQLTPRRSYDTMPRRGSKATVSRSLVLLAY